MSYSSYAIKLSILKYIISIFTRLYKHHHYLIPEHFYHPQKKPPPIRSHSHFPLLSAPGYLLIYFIFLQICLKHNHIWSFVSVFFTEHIFEVQSCCSMSASTLFFLWLNNFPLYGYITFYLPVYQLMNRWVLSTFWLLRITLLRTSTYMFLYEHIFNSLRYIPRSRTAGSYGKFVYLFLGTASFPQWLHHFTIPPLIH